MDWRDVFFRSPGGPVAPLPAPCCTRRQAWAVGALFSLFFAVLYIWTAAPSLAAGHDSGELTTCCVIQGVPHSPGYPLFVALGWLGQHLPVVGPKAYAINLLSAVEAGLALGFLGAGLALGVGVRPAVLATALAGTCTAIWRQAVVTEVFALHLLFLAMLTWLAILWEQAEDSRRRELLIVTGFVLGCTLAHHHIIALAAPAFLGFGVLSKGKGRAWGFSFPALLVFVLAVALPYALQMAMAHNQPPLNWENVVTFERLQDHFLRRSYGTGMLNEASLQFDSRAGEAQASAYVISLLRNYYPLPSFLFLLLAADRVCQSRLEPRLWLYAGIFVLYGPWFALLGNQPSAEFYSDLMERFYSSSMLGAAGLIAFGADWLLKRWAWPDQWVAGLLLIPLYCGVLNFEKSSQRGQFHPVDLMRAILQQVPPNSLLITGGDLPAGVSDYLRYAEGERKDVVRVLPGLAASDFFLDRLPVGVSRAATAQGQQQDLTHEVALDNILAYMHRRGTPVFSNETPKVKGTFLRLGLVYRHFPEGEPLWSDDRVAEELLKNFRLMEAAPRRGDYRQNWRQSFWTRYCIGEWIAAYKAVARGLAVKDPEAALQALERVADMEASPSFDVYFNRGGLRLRLGQAEEALQDYELCLKLQPHSRLAVEGSLAAYRKLNNADKVRQLEQMLQSMPAATP